MNFLAFDLGASSGKAFVGRFTGDALALDSVHHFENGPVQTDVGLCWNYVQIHQNMLQAIGLAGQQTGGQLASFGVDTFSNDFGLIDAEGRLLSPLFCYRDKRTARCRDAIYGKVSPEEFYRATGNQVALFNTAMQLAAMWEEKQEALLHKADSLLFLPDLLLHSITGQAACEYTIASVSQLYSWQQQAWCQPLLEKLHIPKLLLPCVQMPGTLRGYLKEDLASRLGVQPFAVISVCQHDTASAFLSVLGPPGGAIISSGTWAVVGAESKEPLVNDFGMRHNIANEGGYPGHHRLLCSLMGNWILQEVRRQYGQQGNTYTFSEMEKMAEAEEPLRWFFDVDDEIFFTPGNMKQAIRTKAQAADGSAPETPGEMVRCIYESMTLKSLWTIEKLEGLIGQRMPHISVVGGGSRDALACQLLANAAARPVLAGPANASALGNIMVQMMAAGQISSIEEGQALLRRSFPPAVYMPQPSGGWVEAYGRFKEKFSLIL